MSQDSRDGTAHPTGVAQDVSERGRAAVRGEARERADYNVAKTGPAARGKAMVHGLSASSAGLELGIAVAIGALFGHWLDTEYGTQPWLMLVFLVFGLIAGFRGLFRAIARAEKADS